MWGASWGATLALASAQRHPQRVSEIVLGSVTMTRPAEIHWLYHGVGRFFPRNGRVSRWCARTRPGRRPGRRLLPPSQ
ncbi:MAG: alpha/beta fold hydrolase [Pseudonocardiaceae bacterium]